MCCVINDGSFKKTLFKTGYVDITCTTMYDLIYGFEARKAK